MRHCHYFGTALYTTDSRRWQAALPRLEEDVPRIARLTWAAVCLDKKTAIEPGCGEICVVLSSDEEVRTLNRTFRNIDKPTNVLSFPADDDETGPGDDPLGTEGEIPGEQVLGDIVLAFETVTREAAEQKKNISSHFSHLLAHGILHLLGYDHQTEGDAGQMEDLERKILGQMGISDPWQTDNL